jgi:uncharacterized integral membrane protein (TIGR00698 family)
MLNDDSLTRFLPGLVLCFLVAFAASVLQNAEQQVVGSSHIEALVIAIVLGMALRALWAPGPRWRPGIALAAKTLLEVAVVLLGAGGSVRTVLALGPGLLFGIVAIVVVAIGSSYGISRAFGLPRRMAILVACGNSICGNSAIAAVAPVIGASSDDVASSIAFTAVLGVVVVLLLPFLVPIFQLSPTQYGVLAGLTVYAVPQVMAATLPIGVLSNQVGTVIKLVRVLMLGPVVFGMSLLARRLREESDSASPSLSVPERQRPGRLPLRQLVPWFIVGFLLVVAVRSFGWIPEAALLPIKAVASVLTTVSMAALGLGVDVQVVAAAGLRVACAVTLSLVVLCIISLSLVRFVGVS